MSRILRLFVLMSSIVIATAVAAPVDAASSGQRGWVYHVLTIIHCDQPECAGTEVLPPWIKTLRNPFDATTDGQRHFYHRATIIAIGRPGHPHRCDASLFDKPFSGRCVVHDFGIGTIAPGAALPGKNDFFVSSETASFNGSALVANPFPPYPIDTYQIAFPGNYSTRDQLGTKPKGVRLTQVVTRVHR